MRSRRSSSCRRRCLSSRCDHGFMRQRVPAAAATAAEQARWDELAAQQQLQAEVPVVAL